MKLKQKRLALAGALLAVVGVATAGTGGSTDFNDVTTRLEAWLNGSLGKTFALGALAVGLAIGIVKQSVMSVVTGAAVALSASIGPGVLTNVFTAVI